MQRIYGYNIYICHRYSEDRQRSRVRKRERQERITSVVYSYTFSYTSSLLYARTACTYSTLPSSASTGPADSGIGGNGCSRSLSKSATWAMGADVPSILSSDVSRVLVPECALRRG